MGLKEKILLHEIKAKGFNYNQFDKALKSICVREGIVCKALPNGFELSHRASGIIFKTIELRRRDGNTGYIDNNNRILTITPENGKKFLLSLKGFNKRAKALSLLIQRSEKILEAVKKKDPSIRTKLDTYNLSMWKADENTFCEFKVGSKLYGEIEIDIRLAKKSITLEVEGKSKEIKNGSDLKELFVRKTKKDVQAIEVANQIKSELDRFVSGGYGDDDDATISGKQIEKGVRHLGNWLHDEEDHYGDNDDSWREDDDQMIWDPKSRKFYVTKFKEWVKGKSWKKYVKSINIETGEKNWVYFSIYLK